MARLVKTVEGQLVKCSVKTIFDDGSSVDRILSIDDVVEGLRYVEDEEVKSVTGRISAITSTCSKVTPVSLSAPKDYFAKDVILSKISVDASEEYHSDIVTLDAREIVENEGEENVSKVEVTAVPEITLEFTYTDGSIVQQSIQVGDVLCDMVIMTYPGKPDIRGDFRVAAFSYSAVKQKVNISG